MEEILNSALTELGRECGYFNKHCSLDRHRYPKAFEPRSDACRPILDHLPITMPQFRRFANISSCTFVSSENPSVFALRIVETQTKKGTLSFHGSAKNMHGTNLHQGK